MDYKDFIKPGEKCIHIPEKQDDGLWWYDPQVVTIGEYSPYYTDGTPDPKPEDYNEWNFVEIEGETKWGESQIALCSLLPIFEEKEGKEVLYLGKEYKLYGADEFSEYYVIERDDELKVVDSDDCDVIRHIPELSTEECCELYKQISIGSIYFSDYRNTLGVSDKEASDYGDGYLEYLYEKYGEQWEEYDTPDEFAYYCA